MKKTNPCPQFLTEKLKSDFISIFFNSMVNKDSVVVFPQVKFTSNDAKLELGDGQAAAEEQYPALTKSELMAYAADPFWVKLRWVLFVLFWAVWVAMVAASVAIIVNADKCPAPPAKQWWQKGAVYEVYVKSFKDSKADGEGDLNGSCWRHNKFIDIAKQSLFSLLDAAFMFELFSLKNHIPFSLQASPPRLTT